MVRFYRLGYCKGNTYELIDYFLDPSECARVALERAQKLPKTDYVFVSQIDVYPSRSETNEFLRVDGLAR